MLPFKPHCNEFIQKFIIADVTLEKNPCRKHQNPGVQP